MTAHPSRFLCKFTSFFRQFLPNDTIYSIVANLGHLYKVGQICTVCVKFSIFLKIFPKKAIGSFNQYVDKRDL